MKIEDFVAFQKRMAELCIATSVGKNKDYASQEETFQSFKTGSAIIRLLGIDAQTPKGDALCCVVRKLARICNLERKSIIHPVNEPIEDSVRDMHVYLDLYAAMALEETKELK